MKEEWQKVALGREVGGSPSYVGKFTANSVREVPSIWTTTQPNTAQHSTTQHNTTHNTHSNDISTTYSRTHFTTSATTLKFLHL